VRPFEFPASLHRRPSDPGPFPNYRKYKPFLKDEFKHVCVYCRMPDAFSRKIAFGVDHYRPVALFPWLETSFPNLFYACNACNSLKQDYWPRPKALEADYFLPNPVDHRMADHLRYVDVVAIARTKPGEVAIEVFDLNGEDAFNTRETVWNAIEAMMKDLSSLELTRKDIVRAHRREKDPKRKAQLAAGLTEQEARIEQQRQRLRPLGAV
jgi:hypothetical protein